jgi:PLP dependent protein
MSLVIDNFIQVKKIINDNNINIIAVSKSFQYEKVKPLVETGHKHFGENKVQEAKNKWLTIRNEIKDIKLHMIGKLQSNKAKEAVSLFDYIHSLDNPKLASLLSKFEELLEKKRKYFIQVNIGRESQKGGIKIEQLENFFYYCSRDLKLNVIGLMAIPPNDDNQGLYFKHLMFLNESLGLKELSIGMSGDFVEAIKYKATFVRIGSAIFGNRS